MSKTPIPQKLMLKRLTSLYLNLTFTIEKDGKLSAKLYDKCDDFVISTMSNFHSCQVMYHLALLLVFTTRSSLDMQDAAHTIVVIKC